MELFFKIFKLNNIIRFPAFSNRLNAVVFFIITNVEHDVFESGGPAQDMYAGSTVGELGCWIDSTVTRIIQTGVEHSRVPIVGGYIGLGMFHEVVI